MEIHTRFPLLHWLPKTVFDKILTCVGKGWATGNYMNLLRKKDIKAICKAAGARRIEIKGNRLLGIVMDYSIIVAK
ncbi:hypothetical protein Barb7_00512 [Bacteroidales bacterium Barb7]|nr:hypothetical protein Barb7_00512 [Bacteroidales bacterium Barb7]